LVVLLCTRFTTLPILYPGSSWLNLPATPSTLLLVPFIFAVPFAAFAFTGGNLFAPEVKLTTLAELRPWGWTAVDAWIPPLHHDALPHAYRAQEGLEVRLRHVPRRGRRGCRLRHCHDCDEARAIWNFAPRPKKSGKKSKKAKKVEKEKAKAE
jgi:hypothetical protein